MRFSNEEAISNSAGSLARSRCRGCWLPIAQGTAACRSHGTRSLLFNVCGVWDSTIAPEVRGCDCRDHRALRVLQGDRHSARHVSVQWHDDVVRGVMDGSTAGEYVRSGPCIAGWSKPAAFLGNGRLGSRDSRGVRRDRKEQEPGHRRTSSAEDGLT